MLMCKAVLNVHHPACQFLNIYFISSLRTRPENLGLTTPIRLLVYKNYKKNIHRAMKVRAERKRQQHIAETGANGDAGAVGGGDSDNAEDNWLRDNQQTMQKMLNIRSQLDSMKGRRKPLLRYAAGEAAARAATAAANAAAVAANAQPEPFYAPHGDELDYLTDVGAVGGVRGDHNLPPIRQGNGGYSTAYAVRLGGGPARQQSLPQIATAVTSAAVVCSNCFDYRNECICDILDDEVGAGGGADDDNNDGAFNAGGAGVRQRSHGGQPLFGGSNGGGESRVKLRDNIRRNRSFKTINHTAAAHELFAADAGDDGGGSRSGAQPMSYSRQMFGRPQSTFASTPGAGSAFRRNGIVSSAGGGDGRGGGGGGQHCGQSTSVHDLIEQFSSHSATATAHGSGGLDAVGKSQSSQSDAGLAMAARRTNHSAECLSGSGGGSPAGSSEYREFAAARTPYYHHQTSAPQLPSLSALQYHHHQQQHHHSAAAMSQFSNLLDRNYGFGGTATAATAKGAANATTVEGGGCQGRKMDGGADGGGYRLYNAGGDGECCSYKMSKM